jgi:hypothetical protein
MTADTPPHSPHPRHRRLPVRGRLTHLQVTADNEGGGPVFIGIGRADEVDRYLAGVSTDRVADLDLSLRVEHLRHDRSGTPGAPAEQNIRVASSTSRDAALPWEIRDSQDEVVMMNADGSANVWAQTRFGVSPRGFDVAIGRGWR